jgi:hypothetical protein
MGNRDFAGLGRMFEVVVAASRANELPAIAFQLANDIA